MIQGNANKGLGEGGLSGSAGVAANAQLGPAAVGVSTPLAGSGTRGSLLDRTTLTGGVGAGLSANATRFGSITATSPKALS